ncbi:ATP-binding protein [Paractinoplanes globisporus]|uniref:ATP-binding protein n=1 Tax=Paractinoplanes globisporus TaxID=113565 RepID=A0ABW6WA90_9ACTN|nr:ATP-binding protein [Actinoplanes globisporus]
MAAPLGWTVDESDGLAVVAVRGRLDLRGAAGLRTVLLKCLAEQPGALLVDLSAMDLRDDTALAVFAAVARQAARWPGTPVVICGPPPGIAVLLARRYHGRLVVHDGVEAGRRAVAEGQVVVPAVSEQLLPLPGAARHARNLVTEACATWGLSGLVGPACMVASELVSNAVEHGGTRMTFQLSRRPRHLHLAVRDDSPGEPVVGRPDGASERGRGLLLVESTATHWGWLPSRDGKVVWATFRT